MPETSKQKIYLPQEIVNHIIGFVGIETSTHVYRGGKLSCYGPALSLCTISHTFRREAMRHILRCVILLTTSDVRRFTNALRLQRNHRETGSPLALDYTALVKHLWCRRCEWRRFAEGRKAIDYSLWHDVIANLEFLGIEHDALPLLCHTLALSQQHNAAPWRCSKVVFCGSDWTWHILTSTKEGLAFLSRITHLQCWLFDLDDDSRFVAWRNGMTYSRRNPLAFQTVPLGFAGTPFDLFPSMTHFTSCFFEENVFFVPPFPPSLVVSSIQGEPPLQNIVESPEGQRKLFWLTASSHKWHELFLTGLQTKL